MNTDGSTTPVATKPSTAQKPALGVRVTIYQLFDDGGTKMASPNTVFTSGSRIRLALTSNKPGYLYLMNVGSTRKVATLFPTALTDNNQVQPGLIYQIPQQTGKSIRFDRTPGEELILVVLAEAPLRSFDYGGQQISIQSTGRPANAQTDVPNFDQPLLVSNLDQASTSKDLFVEDDGVFRYGAVSFTPEASSKSKVLVMPLVLIHR